MEQIHSIDNWNVRPIRSDTRDMVKWSAKFGERKNGPSMERMERMIKNQKKNQKVSHSPLTLLFISSHSQIRIISYIYYLYLTMSSGIRQVLKHKPLIKFPSRKPGGVGM
jgi:hypothetical protein